MTEQKFGIEGVWPPFIRRSTEPKVNTEERDTDSACTSFVAMLLGVALIMFFVGGVVGFIIA